MDIPLIIGITTDKDSYEKYVLRFGFPGQNHSQHTVMYRMLKDHSLSRCIAQIRQKRRGYRLALLTGARRDESTRRMGTVQNIQMRKNDVWINPIADWSKTDIHHYFNEKGIERSIVAKTIGRSGECNCGVYGHPNELLEIKQCSPKFYDYMKDLEKRVKERGFFWKWGESPPKDWECVSEGQMQLEGLQSEYYSQQMFMCTTCTNNNAYGKSSYDLSSKQRQRAIEEHRILQESCEGNTKHVLAIGNMLRVMEKFRYNDEERIKNLKKIIEEEMK
jgi:3'-phosphoadenosine 5'-phosphosulfate sulfotransferase (PAPS reductase)/FAD synthetase